MLGVSRAFGDIMYKSTHTLQPLTAEESLSGDVFSIWSEDNQVISNPEVGYWSCYLVTYIKNILLLLFFCHMLCYSLLGH